MPKILVDSSFLIALTYPRDQYHTAAADFAKQNQQPLLIPDVVLPEVMFNLKRVGGIRAAVRLAKGLSQAPPFVPLTAEDFSRAMDVMQAYPEANLDFVDCCLVAIGERFNITTICTFDRRDFGIIRPQHVSYFNIQP
jgi:uncharacterized protein